MDIFPGDSNDTLIFLMNITDEPPTRIRRGLHPLVIVQFVLSALGIIGNLLCLLVFSRSTFSHLSLSVFLRTLAVLDIIVILVFNIATVEAAVMRPRPVTYEDSRFHPVAQWFITSLTTSSAWTIVAVSIERVTAVLSPLNVKIMFTKKRAVIAVLIGIPIFFAMNIPTLILEPPPYGVIPLPEYYAIIYSLIPSIIIVLCNVLLLRKMHSRSKKARNTSDENKGITIMLVVNSLGFVLLTLPYPLYELTDQNLKSGAGIANILILITGINHMVNFIFYGIGGTVFRRELKMMLCHRCIKSKEDSTNSQRQTRMNRANITDSTSEKISSTTSDDASKSSRTTKTISVTTVRTLQASISELGQGTEGDVEEETLKGEETLKVTEQGSVIIINPAGLTVIRSTSL